ncbi:MAG: Uncharacterised protein [Bacteroidia bacterium]|nr:MAG: Uncharacterised protein [Bacteroidia bacterium]
MVDFAINYYSDLLKKFGKGKERRTEIRNFEEINTKVVAVANEKLYANKSEGFVGTGIKKEEYICDCSDIDDIIVFRKDGTYSISKVSTKAFFGKNIIHIAVFRKNDDRLTYNAVYTDGKTKNTFAKRFNVTSITRDKEYNVTKGNTGSKMLYFSANPNGEAELVNVYLHAAAKARNKLFDYDFSELAIKGRTSQGNIVSKHPVRKVDLKEKGVSTIGGRDIWYEQNIGRLNIHSRGNYLGSFQTEDQILVIYNNGDYELTNHELTNHYANKEIALIEKFNPKHVLSILHYDGNNKNYYVKRFIIETTTQGKRFSFITEGRGSKMILASTQDIPSIELTTKLNSGDKKTETVNLEEFIDIKGWKSIGNKICGREFVKAKLLKPIPSEEPLENQKPNENTSVTQSDKNTEEKVKSEEIKKEDAKTSLDKPIEIKSDTIENEVISSSDVLPKAESKSPSPKAVEKKSPSNPKSTKEKDDDSNTFTSGDQISLL